jgi:ABC-type lipoprotein release transport system permease subunit
MNPFRDLPLMGKLIVRYNLRNLLVRWKITILTALAFTLVIGLLTVMRAVVSGMYKLTEGSGNPANVMVLADGATDELFSNLGYGDIKEIELRDGVARDEENKPLASWEIYVLANQPIAQRPETDPGLVGRWRQSASEFFFGKQDRRRRRFIQVRGVDDPARSGRVHNLPLQDGGAWFSPAGVERLPGGDSAIQAVIGEGLAKELGKDKGDGKQPLAPGDTFELGGRTWVVSGVMLSGGSTFDSEVWGKRDLVGSLYGKASYTTVVVRARDADAAKALAADLTANYKKPAVNAKQEIEYYESLNTFNTGLLYAVRIVAVIMAVGGVFGVMNTMFAAISQRTRDIGVLRIVGYGRLHILVSFFVEALLLALLGGALGCLAGSLVDGASMTSIVSSGQGGGGKSVVLKLIVDGPVLLEGMIFALAMGCVGGLLPALSAMRLRPLDSLR